MDGSALYQSILLIFMSQLAGADLSPLQALFIVLLTMASSAGTAGIPGGGIALMAFMLDLLGLPQTYLALYLVVDRFFDYPITAINVWGDLVVAAVVDKDLRRPSAYDRKHQMHGFCSMGGLAMDLQELTIRLPAWLRERLAGESAGDTKSAGADAVRHRFGPGECLSGDRRALRRGRLRRRWSPDRTRGQPGDQRRLLDPACRDGRAGPGPAGPLQPRPERWRKAQPSPGRLGRALRHVSRRHPLVRCH
jgi:hypothetical protein